MRKGKWAPIVFSALLSMTAVLQAKADFPGSLPKGTFAPGARVEVDPSEMDKWQGGTVVRFDERQAAWIVQLDAGYEAAIPNGTYSGKPAIRGGGAAPGVGGGGMNGLPQQNFGGAANGAPNLDMPNMGGMPNMGVPNLGRVPNLAGNPARAVGNAGPAGGGHFKAGDRVDVDLGNGKWLSAVVKLYDAARQHYKVLTDTGNAYELPIYPDRNNIRPSQNPNPAPDVAWDPRTQAQPPDHQTLVNGHPQVPAGNMPARGPLDQQTVKTYIEGQLNPMQGFQYNFDWHNIQIGAARQPTLEEQARGVPANGTAYTVMTDYTVVQQNYGNVSKRDSQTPYIFYSDQFGNWKAYVTNGGRGRGAY